MSGCNLTLTPWKSNNQELQRETIKRFFTNQMQLQTLQHRTYCKSENIRVASFSCLKFLWLKKIVIADGNENFLMPDFLICAWGTERHSRSSRLRVAWKNTKEFAATEATAAMNWPHFLPRPLSTVALSTALFSLCLHLSLRTLILPTMLHSGMT